MPIHIVSIGSSFAAGPGITPQVDSHAKRSGANYAHIVAGRLNAKLTDLSVSGATLSNLIDTPQAGFRHTFPPQVDMISGDADVVLVLGGGNDVGYIGGLFADSFTAYWGFRIVVNAYRWLTGAAEAQTNALGVKELAVKYGQVLDAVHQKAPKAQVLVIEYLTLLGSDVRPTVDVPFDANKLGRHKLKAEEMREATVMTLRGREAWCARVPVAEMSVDHGLGSTEPWINGFGARVLYTLGAYHPNAKGMTAVAELILNELSELGIKS